MKHTYLSQVSGMVHTHKIPPDLVLNWDQAGVKLSLESQNWTMEQQGSSCVEITGINGKHQITLALAGSVSGELLLLQLLYHAKTARCHPHCSYLSEFDVCNTLIIRQTKKPPCGSLTTSFFHTWKLSRPKNNTPDQGALVIFDVLKGHTGEAVHCWKNFHIVVPNNCTNRFQPLDLNVNKPVNLGMDLQNGILRR